MGPRLFWIKHIENLEILSSWQEITFKSDLFSC